MHTPTRHTDIFGKPLNVGTRVRSFDFSMMIDGKPDGMELVGQRANFIEGVITGFDWKEGCERYVIEASRQVVCGKDRPLTSQTYYPPVNGIPSTLNGRTFGVVAI